MAGEALKLSVDLLYLCVFSVSFWTVLLTLQSLLQHIRALQAFRHARVLQSRCFRLLQCLHAVQRRSVTTLGFARWQPPPAYRFTDYDDGSGLFLGLALPR